jgi:hypothetical protein
MYVRIARFEGGNVAEIEAEGERIRRDLQAARGGGSTTETPPELALLAQRVEMMVDRARGAVAVLVYCETEDQVREADRVMRAMSPTSDGWGERVSAEVYEVFVDEATGMAHAA